MLSFELELQATEMFIPHIKGIIEVINLYQKYSRRLKNPNSILDMTAEPGQVDKENGVPCHYFATIDKSFRPVIGVIVRSGCWLTNSFHQKSFFVIFFF